MKIPSLLLYIILISCVSVSALDKGFKGDWNGQLKIGISQLRLAFHLTPTGGTMDSPDQQAYGITIDSAIIKGNEVTLTMVKLGVQYRGVIEGDTIIRGNFTQRGVSFPLSLKRGVFIRNRPQTPQSPFDYHVENVEFTGGDAAVKLAGTLTIPNDVKNPKCVILLSGSGAQDRDETIMEHKPFLVLADYLTRGGVAVLRFDDRGVGGSTGDFTKATIDDFKRDALAALNYVSARKDIGNKVGFVGHSEGGLVATLAAADEPKNVSFIVSMAGVMVRMDSILIKQNYAIMKASGGVLALSAASYADALKTVYALRERHTIEFINENLDSLRTNILEPKLAKLIDPLKKNVIAVFTMSSVAFNAMIASDPTTALKSLRCEILALNGDKDIQVDADMNLGAVKTLQPNATIKKYEGLNHLFQNCDTGEIHEYSKIEETIAPIVLEDILQWIIKVK